MSASSSAQHATAIECFQKSSRLNCPPVTVWFAVLLGLIGPARAWLPSPVLVRLAWTAVGVTVVFYLIYAELFLIGAVCLWCTAVHGLVLGLFLLALGETTTVVEPA